MTNSDSFFAEGSGLLDRYEEEGDPELLAQALSVWGRAVAATSEPGDRAAFLNNFAYALRLSFEVTGDPEELRQGMDACTEAISLAEPGTHAHAMYLDALALTLRDRYDSYGESADLAQAITWHAQAVAGHPGELLYVNNLAGALWKRYQDTDDRTDLARARELYRQAVDQAGAAAPELAMRLGNLAGVLRTTFELTADPADLEEALAAARAALAAAPPTAIDRPRLLSGLGACLASRFRLRGDPADLDEAEAVCREAVTSRHDPRRGHNLAIILIERYELRGSLADLDEAVSYATEALAAVPEGTPGRSTFLNGLGDVLSTRYNRFGDRADLDQSISLFTAAANLSRSAAYLHNLGGALKDRYASDGLRADLDAAIEAAEEAVSLIPDGLHLNALANALRLRYGITGAAETLDRAVQMHHRAVAATPRDAPTWLTRRHDLGNALHDRYEQTGAIADLDEAVTAFAETAGATPDGSPDRAIRLNNLGNGLRTRYWHSREAAELDQAITAFEQAVADRPEDAIYLDNLGIALGDRAMNTGDGDELERSIQVHRRAVAILPEGAPERPRCLANLATALWARFQAYHERADLDEAIKIQERVVTATPEGAPHVSVRLNNLALLLRERSGLTGDRGDRARATDTYRRAVIAGNATDPLWAMQSALNWAGWAAGREEWTEAAEAYAQSLDGMERLYRSQGQRRHKELMLRATATLAGRAAQAIARAGRPREAALAAERGRALMLSEALERAHPDLSHDLRPAGYDVLVYVGAGPSEGVALVVKPGDVVMPVFLPALSEQAVQARIPLTEASAQLWEGAIDHVTHWLWDVLAEPLLAALPTELTSVALVAAGPLGLLPLHAAWRPDPGRPTGRRYLTDHCAISYQPNARVLDRPPQPPGRLLAVSDPDGSLPSAGHELTPVIAHFRHTTHLVGAAATKEAVMAAMATADVHHFACHGYARPSAPLESAVVLAGGEPLTLRDLLALRLTGRLAVLSACQTQIPGRSLPDELIGLPAGLLEAGVRGVIASHWVVSGLATVLLMTRFYRHWLTAGRPPGQALRLAQVWLRDTTNAQKAADLDPVNDRWARRQMLRRPPEARDFAHPSIWAAFSHTGR